MRIGTVEPEGFKVGTLDVEAIYSGTDMVWQSYAGPASPIVITTSQTLIAGIDFPADTDLTICMVGGGRGGNAQTSYDLYHNPLFVSGGGMGQVVTAIVPSVLKDTEMSAIVGGGGIGANANATPYGNGTSSSFGGVVAQGGTAGFTGNGGANTTCGGVGTHGYSNSSQGSIGYGGQSSGFGNGGSGLLAQGSASSGGVGSGGGGGGSQTWVTGGSGGRGEIRISWS